MVAEKVGLEIIFDMIICSAHKLLNQFLKIKSWKEKIAIKKSVSKSICVFCEMLAGVNHLFNQDCVLKSFISIP